MSLSNTSIRNAKADEKSRKLFDGGGLYLEVTPRGGKWWRLKYRFEGKEKRLSLGVYPDVTLKDARTRRDEARKLLVNGVDPSEQRKAEKAARANEAANSFEALAREWFAKRASIWSPSHATRVISQLEGDVFPWIGPRPITRITAPQLLETLRRIEQRGALETAYRVLSYCSQVFRYAIATGRAAYNPSGDLRGALPPVKGKHFASVTEPGEVGQLLRTLDGYQGTLVVKCALRFAPLVFVRPGELRQAQWVDMDLDNAEWRFHVTKTRTQHIVPLSRQAIEILRELQPLTGRGKYVFPSARSPRGDRPMSENAVLAAMRGLGIGKEVMSGHGFRAMARTILDEVLKFRPDYIEHQLAHSVRDPNGRAYNRTAHLAERRKMMQAWADYLDQLRVSGEVIPIFSKAVND
ncbi:MAG: integrase arm-type DNA-binding domain-containing protein [Gammaproteobacteria bacterium]|nr:integrase arm-type DNA-binding domain-containing protein [Gammaproteobacteria bacterium]MDE0411981.1 integrase arm-type DNA-binding domain-containing protein [Gammaproteobacteria bacterium]